MTGGRTQHPASSYPRPPDPRRASTALALGLRVGLIVVLLAGVLQLQAEADYHVSSGSVAFQIRPAWPGGRLIMPLGPAGELSLRTHRTPVDVVMKYQLPEETVALTGGDGLAGQVPRIEGGARAAFSRYLAGRVPWLVVVGLAAGLLAVGRWTRRRLILGGAAGIAAALVLGATAALGTYATLDRSPSVEYRGLASRVPAVLPLVRALSTGGDQSDRLSRLQDYLDGFESVAAQLTVEPRRPERADVTRLLLASDFHDNVFGARVAARLTAGGGDPIDGVLLAGDITDRGTAEEAQLFVRVFGRPAAPVVVVGGNHEDAPAMAVFERAGYVVLDGETVPVSGVTVLGASDPVSRSARVESDIPALAAAGAALARRWAAAAPRPQVVLVHDLRQADDTVALAREDERRLVVAYGNDHVGSVRRQGSVVLVDAGTAGASGYEAIGASSPASTQEPPAHGRDVYTFQLIDFSRDATPKLAAVTTLSYGRDGRTVVSYVPFGE